VVRVHPQPEFGAYLAAGTLPGELAFKDLRDIGLGRLLEELLDLRGHWLVCRGAAGC
jgi:hypothetical protein